MTSVGYSDSGARGKDFQKLMFFKRKKSFDLIFHFFLPKSRCSLKKKKKVFASNSSPISLFFSQNHSDL